MFESFNPSGVAVKNGNFIGLPCTESESKIVLLPVPWEATVSYNTGCADGPKNILDASYQLDLYDVDVPQAWRAGIFMRPTDAQIRQLSEKIRQHAAAHIDALEAQQKPNTKRLQEVNQGSRQLNQWVYEQTKQLIEDHKFVGLIGGEHSVPLGYYKALAERYPEFGILHIDAHCDLRQAYEDFTYSHASIFYNTMEEIPAVRRLVQVGIRDFCQEELDYAYDHRDRISIFFDHSIRERIYEGETFQQIAQNIVAALPPLVHISFDIDGLDPKLCPNTGTPVAGGLQLLEAFYLIKQVIASGRRIIGFDLCEVGSASEWDGNVGARVLYKLCALLCKSQGLV